MQNISPQIFKQVQEAICRPEGTFTFKYRSKDLFDKSKRGGVILEIPSGQHLFRLERDDALFLALLSLGAWYGYAGRFYRP